MTKQWNLWVQIITIIRTIIRYWFDLDRDNRSHWGTKVIIGRKKSPHCSKNSLVVEFTWYHKWCLPMVKWFFKYTEEGNEWWDWAWINGIYRVYAIGGIIFEIFCCLLGEYGIENGRYYLMLFFTTCDDSSNKAQKS